MGPTIAVREARAWLVERSDPTFEGARTALRFELPVVRVPANRMSRPGRAYAPYRVMTRTEGDVVHVCLLGEVGVDTVGQIRERFETSTAGAKRVVLDLSGVTSLGPTGLQMVLETDAAARVDGWELRLIGAPAEVQRVFDLTGARARLPFLTASQLSALLATPGDAPNMRITRRPSIGGPATEALRGRREFPDQPG